MKKNAILICNVILVLIFAATSCVKSNKAIEFTAETSPTTTVSIEKQNPQLDKVNAKSDFFMSLGPRFNGIKKEKLNNARSFADFIGDAHVQRIVSYKSLEVVLLEDNKQTSTKEITDSGVFSPAQLALLQSFDYSTNLLVRADYKEKNIDTDVVEDSYWTPHLTIVPETQASYLSGDDGIIRYLDLHSKDETISIEKDKLKPGIIYFTITKEGIISDTKLVSSCGFPKVDNKLTELISNLPEKWQPASNVNGENVEQILVLSFGNAGC
jgi:hypothetical protein